MATMKVQFELTDTFGGEANYSWVRRHTEHIADSTTDRALVRRAKAWAGWQGLRAQTYTNGDAISVHPASVCQVMFITWGRDNFNPIAKTFRTDIVLEHVGTQEQQS